MMLTVLFLRFFDLQPTCAPTARMMVKHTPAIPVLYSVRVTLTNHYWVTSDKRRRSRFLLGKTSTTIPAKEG